MTDSTVPSALRVKQWDDSFFAEYIRDNRFAKYMGTSPTSMIQVREDLMKKKGDAITFQLVNRLTGAGVSGNSTLEGSEEDMTQRSFTLTVDQYRHGVRVPSFEEQASAISLREAARDVLLDWATQHTKSKILTALGSINGVAYGSASEGQKDAWSVDNSDRILFGAVVGNYSGDHSADLAKIDNTADKLTYGVVSLAKRIAKTADPYIRPIRVKGDEEWFVLFTGSRTFRDLKASLATIHQNAEVRGRDNPLFTDGDLVYDGVIIREIPEIALTGSVGDSSIAVAPSYLCGAQALAAAYARRWESKTETFDYGDKYGVAIRGTYQIGKATFGKGAADTDDLVQHGVVTLYNAAVADA